MPLLSADARLALLYKQFGAVNFTPPSYYVIQAVTEIPDDAAGSNIGYPSDASYLDLQITNSPTEFGESADFTSIVNLNDWAFAQATEDWGSVFGIAVWDDSANYYGYIPFSSPKYVESGSILQIKSGSFIVTMDDTPLSVSIEEALMPTIKTDSNGNRYIISVSTAGAMVVTATTFFGPPAPPTSLTNTSGTLSWTAPAYDGGSPVISYTIWRATTSDQLVAFDVVGPSTLSYDTQSTAGVYFVTAENPVGSSDPSGTVTIS